jgi:hypothetical protein
MVRGPGDVAAGRQSDAARRRAARPVGSGVGMVGAQARAPARLWPDWGKPHKAAGGLPPGRRVHAVAGSRGCTSTRLPRSRLADPAAGPPCPPHPPGAHFYCETLDITRPFPSDAPPGQPSWPFVWNRWVGASFRAAGLDGDNAVCPALLQVGLGLRVPTTSYHCCHVRRLSRPLGLPRRSKATALLMLFFAAQRAASGRCAGQQCAPALILDNPGRMTQASGMSALASLQPSHLAAGRPPTPRLPRPSSHCGARQGMAEGRDLEDFDGKRFSYCLISRRCRLHVGPRYKARGLNELADPGGGEGLAAGRAGGADWGRAGVTE